MKKIGNLLLVAAFCVIIATGLTACKKSYELSFNTNSEVTIGNISVREGEEITLPVPERSGYSFEGWFESEDLSGSPVVKANGNKNAAFFAKWAKLYLLTLDTDGGTLAAESLQVKEGENLSHILKDEIPVKSGLVFGQWFIGENEITDKKTMPASDLTVTARYKAEYTVEIYKEKLNYDGASEKYEKETKKGYAYVNKVFTVSDVYNGFKEVTESDTTSSKTISSVSSENVFKVYYERKEIAVFFRAGDSSEEAIRKTYKYGYKLSFPSYFEKNGFWLSGWAEDGSDKIYKAGRTIVNDPDGSVAPDETIIEEDTVFTAVWIKGYSDVFGGTDYLFVLDGEPDSIYLIRGGLCYKGRLTKTGFFFKDVSLSGKLNADKTFSYSDAERSELALTRYSVDGGLDKNVTILFDQNDGISYKNGSDVSKGYYKINEKGEYTATFESGTLKGSVMTFRRTTAVEEDSETGARNEVEAFIVKERAAETVRSAFINDNGEFACYTSAYAIEFDGYGTAVYNDVRNGNLFRITLYCSFDNDRVTLKNDGDEIFGVISLMDNPLSEYKGTLCYMLYNEELDGEFTCDNGDVLRLNGLYNVDYTSGGNTVTGYYSVKKSVFGGKIITVIAADQSGKTEIYRFLLEKTVNSSSGEIDGNDNSSKEETAVYKLTRKGKNYKEFYFMGKNDDGENNAFYAPLLVTDDTAEGAASLYGYTSFAKYVLLSSGTYGTADNGTTTYRAVTFSDSESVKDVVVIKNIDAAKVKTFDCYLSDFGAGAAQYGVAHWFGYEKTDGAKQNNAEVYNSAADGKLLLSAGVANYVDGDTFIYGSCVKEGNFITVSYDNGTAYFKINGEDMTFSRLESRPFTAYLYNPDGAVSESEYVIADGNGGGYYFRAEGELKGKVKPTEDSSAFGAAIYEFTSTDNAVSFRFIILKSSSSLLFAKYDKNYGKNYVHNNEELILDGFGFYGSYTVEGKEIYKGVYRVESENTISMEINGLTRYFDLNGRFFTLRGEEYGVYTVTDNNYADYTEFYELDGYDAIKSFTVNDDGSYSYAGEGLYTLKDGRVFFTITVGASETSGEFAIGNGKIEYKGKKYGLLVTVHKEKVSTYVNPSDWSALILDDKSGAVRISKNGVTQSGGYTLITDNLLYFFTSDGADGSIFRYDATDGTAVPVQLGARGYYKENLDSLLFTKYGFAIFNGSDRYYYDINENDDVIIYKRDGSSTSSNGYGFSVDDSFGKFEDVKQYKGDTYYSNNGFDIRFERSEEGKEKFPVALTAGAEYKYPVSTMSFAPGSGASFKADASVVINGRTYKATVTKNEDGSMTLTVGNYVFDISVVFRGENTSGKVVSTYSVTALRGVISAPAYKYLDNYYRVYVTEGAKAAGDYKNNVGTVYVNTVYDDTGKEISSYVSASFGEGSEYYDADGKLLSIENASYTYDKENAVYIAEFNSRDGYKYRFAFGLRYHSAFRRTFGYYVFYLTRTETLETGNYTVGFERYIGSDNGKALGAIFGVTFKKGGVEIKHWGSITYANKTEILFISRETDADGKILSATYYRIISSYDSGVEIGGNDKILPPLKSVTVTEEPVTFVSTENGEIFADFNAENKVVLLVVNGKGVVASSTEYNADTGVYTVIAGGKTYTFKLNGNVIVEFKEEK